MGRSYYRVESDCGFVTCRPDNTPYEGGRYNRKFLSKRCLQAASRIPRQLS